MPEANGWSVRRTWWELTKLLLRGLGGYDLYVRVDDLDDEAQKDFDSDSWGPVRIHWTDDRDHFAVITAEAQGSADA